ncbi:DUF1918 domain-containing protein [Streptomyces sp. NPDC001781]
MSAPAPARRTQAVTYAGPGVAGAWVRARTGDEIVASGTTAGAVARHGGIVGLHHHHGSPPYDVRWAEGGRVAPYSPGSDACVRHLASGGGHVRAR